MTGPDRCDDCGTALADLHEHEGVMLCLACYQRRPDPEGVPSAPTVTVGDDDPGAPMSTDRYAGRRLDVAALLAEPDTPIPWRCDRFAADGYLTVLAGRGGEGKSWLALAMALGVATGTTGAGIYCRRGRALLLDAENGRDLLRRRLRAAGVTDGVEVALADGLDIVTDAAWFAQAIRTTKANLVVIDSLRMLTSGRDEDKSGAMEAPLSTLRRLARDTGAAIILIHHKGKGSSDYRGSSVIVDQCDLLFSLGRVDGDPDARTRRKLHTAKCRIAEEPEPRWIAINADSAAGTVTVDEAEAHEGGGGGGGRPRDTLREDVLEALTGIARTQASVARAVGRAAKDQTVRRVLADLAGEGLAHRRDSGWAAGPEGVSGVIPLGVDTLTPPPAAPVAGPGPAPWEPGGTPWKPYTAPTVDPCSCEHPMVTGDGQSCTRCWGTT